MDNGLGGIIAESDMFERHVADYLARQRQGCGSGISSGSSRNSNTRSDAAMVCWRVLDMEASCVIG